MSPMKTTVVLLAALTPTLAIADSVYQITDIGDLPGGGDYSEVVGLNSDGEVVGLSQTAGGNLHGFLWTSANGMQDLEMPAAAGINDSAVVVGSAVFGTMHAALWDAINGTQDLGDLPGGDDFSNGFGINNAGQAVGFSTEIWQCRSCVPLG